MAMIRSVFNRCLIWVFAVLIAGTTSKPGFADAFFQGLAGNWQGKGFVRTDAKSPEENIRCRLSNGIAPSGDRLLVRGNCSIAGFLLPVIGSIKSANTTYSTDLFTNLAGITTESFSGKRSGSSLQLRYIGRNLATQEDIRATMTIAKNGQEGFNINLKRNDPVTAKIFDIGTIRFSPN